MRPIRTFTVVPALPERLQPLRALAYNLHWAWHHDAIALLSRDDELWDRSGHNPVRALGTIDQAELEAAARDEGFLAHLDRVSRQFDEYLNGEATWFGRSHPGTRSPLVAYFSA